MPLVHNPMPTSHSYIGNGTTERAKGYEGWLASRPREESGYAPKRAFVEAERDEKVFNGAESTQEYSKMRRALREVEDNMIVRNPALGAGGYDEKVFGTAAPTNGYPHMKQTVREKDENMFGSKEDQFNNKIYSIEAMHELLNTRQAARQKEINSSLNDNKYGGNTYTPKVGRGHMNMSQEPRQKEHMYAPSPFLSDNDGHHPNIDSAEPGRGYTISKHGARQKEDAYPFSPVIDDDEYRHIEYSAEAGKGYTIIRQTARRKQEVVFALNPVISDGDEYGHMVFVKPPVMESTNTRKAVACGPWGGVSGDGFDDGAYTGIREIILTRAGGIVSIQVCYDMEGRAVWGKKNGGNHGVQVDKIALDYPSEYLTHITGYYGSTVLRGPTTIKSLTFHTNRRKYGPFGDEHGISFSSAGSTESKIVGFNGKIKGWNVSSIGVHVMEAKSSQTALDLLSMIGVRTYEVGRAREPVRWYAEKVYMKMM